MLDAAPTRLRASRIAGRDRAPLTPRVTAGHEGARLLKQVRRLVVGVVGGTVVVVGVAMIVLPGPAIVVIPGGLAILATEFVWARRLLQRVKERSTTLMSSVRGSGSDRGGSGSDRESGPNLER